MLDFESVFDIAQGMADGQEPLFQLPPSPVIDEASDGVASPPEPEESSTDPFTEAIVRFHMTLAEVQQQHNRPLSELQTEKYRKNKEDDNIDENLLAGRDIAAPALGRLMEDLDGIRAEMYVGNTAAETSPEQKDVQQEMLEDCERKTGDVVLNLLRKATSAIAPDPAAAPALFLECVRLKQETKAANIYGGFLQRRLIESTEDALQALDCVRSLRRLQMGSSNSQADDSEGVGQDSQPHVTGLSRLLGEASRMIGSLRGEGYYCEDESGQDAETGTAGSRHAARFSSWLSGPCLARMVTSLNSIAQQQALKLLKWYIEDCSVREWQERCLSARGTEDLVVQELDFALDELQLVLGLSNRYLAFVAAPREECMDLFIQVQELAGCYVSMESAYCNFNVAKAIAWGQPTEVQEGVLVSTLVEDVPMILNRSIERATQTLSDQAILAVASRATELLSPDSVPSFAAALQALVEDRSLTGVDAGGGAMDQFSRALQQQLDEEEGNVTHEAMIYAINSMDCAVAAMKNVQFQYLTSQEMQDMLLELGVRGSCEGESQQRARGGPHMVEAVAQEFGRVLKQYGGYLEVLLDDFASRYVSSGILDYLSQVVGRTNYTIDATTYEKEAAGRGDPFVTQFLDYMFVKDKVLRDCKAGMTGSALLGFVERVAMSLSPALIQALEEKEFTEWGGMKLRQQVRLLQEQLMELVDGHGTLLPQFARVDQMVTLLNLDSPADVHYLMILKPDIVQQPACGLGEHNSKEDKPKSAEVVGRLTPAEVKQILKQRVEFNPQAVESLIFK